jgi:hypothetical protein
MIFLRWVDEWLIPKHTIRGDNMNDDLMQWAENEYEVTYENGEVVEIEAWTPAIAQTIAEEEAETNGRPLAVTSVKLMRAEPVDG